MSEDFDLDNWEPEPAKPQLESMLSKARPFREDTRAEERRKACVPAVSRRYECPGCGIIKWVEPVYSGEEWHYWGQCSHCGTRWVNAYNLMVKCTECGTRNPITRRNPNGQCNCQEEVAGPFTKKKK